MLSAKHCSVEQIFIIRSGYLVKLPRALIPSVWLILAQDSLRSAKILILFTNRPKQTALRQSFDLWEYQLIVGALLLHQIINCLFLLLCLSLRTLQRILCRILVSIGLRVLWQIPKLPQIFHKQFCRELLFFLRLFSFSRILKIENQLGICRLSPNKILHRIQVHLIVFHSQIISILGWLDWPQKLFQRTNCFACKFLLKLDARVFILKLF